MAAQPLNVVILAAGMGKRMHSHLPKVLHELGGRPLLAHVIDTARTLSPQRICVVYGHGGSAVPERFAAKDLVFAEQEPQLGTGHAVMQALPHLDTAARTLVLYGDVPLTRGATLAAMLNGGGKGMCVLTVELDDPTGYGRIVRARGGRITRIVEEKDASARQRRIREVNTGIMLLPARRAADWLARLRNDNAQREYYLTDLVGMAIKDRVAVHSAQPGAAWETLGVNSRAQLAQLERLYQRQIAAELLEQGVTLADPARIDVRGLLSCGRDVTIDVNCVFEGDVVLGNDIVVGANCVLRNVRVRAGTRIAPFCHIEDAEIGAYCRVGPYARLRPGAKLDEEVHVGNFVEIKASEIGARSKANHLSYIGDSTVGRDVNIGAGTITCNYDGANKHRTVIEDDVHIGSDVQLVAPVTVARGATVGAGTTVWRDTQPGGLVLNGKDQRQLPEWKRPVKKAKSKA
ncbi:MAG TPA: bifunctional UDP-N-acetylglucosamine diphosphorylase/glucosamine-1-phosphate N-acetyltransferase GlmU [Burkholderiales bacterium]|nr:bifunctional UDP-N-acetylglucosamine diphosphorylase/glucosamine-1-phosphate N-acetyltransferase GlmU [Burkholderiales bacterium]